MCLLATSTGYNYIGQNYFKIMEHGNEVRRDYFSTEKEYRDALNDHASIGPDSFNFEITDDKGSA